MPKKSQKPNRSPKAVDEEEMSHASATAMRSMRALDYEVQSEGSNDVMAMRVAEVATALSELVRMVGYAEEASELESAGRSIQGRLDKRYGLKPNSRDIPGGLATNATLLQSFVEMAAESQELDSQHADLMEEVYEAAREYDAALEAALEELVKKYPPENGASADDLWNAEAPFLVLMTLRGEGVGIWDGDWTDFYEDTDKAEAFLKKKLSKFADGTGGGSLEEAFNSAAYQTCEGSDDEDDDSDEDDEDDED